jgi:3-hydroxybutyryl-CoA dehydratase
MAPDQRLQLPIFFNIHAYTLDFYNIREAAMLGKTINEIHVGDSAEFAKTISEADIYLFAGVTGDLNPFHVNEEYSRKTYFKGRIAHGMLLAGFISTVVGCKLPGPGAIYVKQELKFLAPARIGDTITAKVTVTDVDVEKNRVVLQTTCSNQNGEIVVDGQAMLSPRKI